MRFIFALLLLTTVALADDAAPPAFRPHPPNLPPPQTAAAARPMPQTDGDILAARIGSLEIQLAKLMAENQRLMQELEAAKAEKK